MFLLTVADLMAAGRFRKAGRAAIRALRPSERPFRICWQLQNNKMPKIEHAGTKNLTLQDGFAKLGGLRSELKGSTKVRTNLDSNKCRGTSLTRNRTTLGPYRRLMPGVLGGS